jgi:hypothetical protein
VVIWRRLIADARSCSISLRTSGHNGIYIGFLDYVQSISQWTFRVALEGWEWAGFKAFENTRSKTEAMA